MPLDNNNNNKNGKKLDAKLEKVEDNNIFDEKKEKENIRMNSIIEEENKEDEKVKINDENKEVE